MPDAVSVVMELCEHGSADKVVKDWARAARADQVATAKNITNFLIQVCAVPLWPRLQSLPMCMCKSVVRSAFLRPHTLLMLYRADS